MVDSEAKGKRIKTKKRKRGTASTEESARHSKLHCVENAEKEAAVLIRMENITKSDDREKINEEEIQFVPPWKNLGLIIALENKLVDTERKVYLAFHYVQSRIEERSEADEDNETVKLPQLLRYLNNWIQSLLVSSDKKNRGDSNKICTNGAEAYCDFRCWEIFRFCLEESKNLNVSLDISKNLLRPTANIARHALALLETAQMSSTEPIIDDETHRMYNTVLDCFSLVFSSHGGLSNENLDSWVSTTAIVLDLVKKLYIDPLENSNRDSFALKFLSLVLEPFSKFLLVHPARKNGFHDFVGQLLEPLLSLMGELHNLKNGSYWIDRVLELGEGVLSHGLFHQIHIDGFLTLQNLERYNATSKEKSNDRTGSVKSYHRHFFEELEKIISTKKGTAMSNFGLLLHLLVVQVKKSKAAPKLYEGVKETEKDKNFNYLENEAVKSQNLVELDSEARKSLFNFFVWIVESLLLNVASSGPANMDGDPSLETVCGTVKAISSLLATFMHEKLYLRTEDNLGGAGLNFLRKVYNFSMDLVSISKCEKAEKTKREDLALVANEIVIIIGYLLEIEYKVIGDDLVNLWGHMLSCLAIDCSLMHMLSQNPLSSRIPKLGGQIINLYGQLRQVNTAFFALCKAIRLLESCLLDMKNSSRFFISASNESHTKAVEKLLGSENFVHAVHVAIKSIPEGQVAGFIQQLVEDVAESIAWMKNGTPISDNAELCKRNAKCPMLLFDLKMELLGSGLSKLYALALDSLNVTEGNSVLVGSAIKELMKLLRPCMIDLVSLQPDAINRFLSNVTGKSIDNEIPGKLNVSQSFQRSTQWIFVFFFQLFISSQCLSRQAISLMPPDLSKKMSREVGDISIAYSGGDLIERIGDIDMGYFSWILPRSNSLHVLLQLIADIYLNDNIVGYLPLVLTSHLMALQRLSNLNRKLAVLKYLGSNDHLLQIKVLEEEATTLTNLLMEQASLVYKDNFSLYGDITSLKASEDTRCNCEECNVGICLLHKKQLGFIIWSKLCENIDIWGSHASKKQVKKFLSFLLSALVGNVRSNFPELDEHKVSQSCRNIGAALQEISSDVTSNSNFFEQISVCRNIASTFCHLLEKSVLPFFKDYPWCDWKLRSSLCWDEILCGLDNMMVVVCGKADISSDSLPVPQHLIRSSDTLTPPVRNEEKDQLHTGVKFTICHHLLNLLCQIPAINTKALSRYFTCIINLERLVVFSLLHSEGVLCQDSYVELLRLFVSCRRAWKHVLVRSEKRGSSEFTLNAILSSGSFSVLWLFKSLSVVISLKRTDDSISCIQNLKFASMDHTSHVFLELGKHQFNHAIHTLTETGGFYEEVSHSRGDEEESRCKSDKHLGISEFLEELRKVSSVAEILKNQMQSLHVSRAEGPLHKNEELSGEIDDWNKYSAVVSCLNGFLWGLASAMNQADMQRGNQKMKELRKKFRHFHEINICINSLAEFLFSFLRIFGAQLEESAATMKLSSSSLVDDESGASKRRLKWEKKISVASFLTKVGSFEAQCLHNVLLQRLLRGIHPELAFLLKQLLIASSAVLRLNMHKVGTPLMSISVPTFIEVSHILLLEFSNMVDVPQQSSFVLLDGVLSYLKELAGHFSFIDPILSGKVFVKLIELHLEAMGKIISLQGKKATLAFHETKSITKTIGKGSSTAYSFCLDELKRKLRMSFQAYIQKQPDLYILSAIQAIERAIVRTVNGGCVSLYGGCVSPVVAAGVDFLEMVLEYISGNKCVSLVKTHIQSMVAAMFDIILHLQTHKIFIDTSIFCASSVSAPDPGSVLLMCVEVLVRVSRTHALFQMETWHVGSCLRIPVAVFGNFHQLRVSESAVSSNSLAILEDRDLGSVAYNVDQHFSIDLYTACCQLLYTVLKHHKSECKQCLPQLQVSVRVLLNCLEMVENESMITKGYFSWKLDEGVKCACFFRRVFEEIGQQKDVIGRHCSEFLSQYISVYSGYGPQRRGIRREIDEALRPGVCALMSACSMDDLQRLHTVFGEGPCRNTLANLQRDYQLNFKYEGKV